MWIKQKAFTMVELMITLLVAAIIVAIAAPSFNSTIRNNHSAALGDDLLGALNLARSEAVKRSTNMSICASNNGTSCTGETNWKAGFIVYRDTAPAETSTATTVVAADVLKVWPPQDTNAVVSVKRGGVDVAFVRFTSLGVLARINNSTVTVLSQITGCKGNAARTMTVNLSGQIGTQRTACP